MYTLCVWTSALFMMFGTVWYCALIFKDKVCPPISSFIILSTMFCLSFFLYIQKMSWSFGANVGLITATIGVLAILVSITIKSVLQKRLSAEFSRFQIKMLIAAGTVLAIWFVTDNHLISYILLQVIAIIGYIPIIKKNWGVKEDKESAVLWSSIFLSALVASYTAWQRNDLEAWIYIGRAIPSTAFVLGQVLSIRIKNLNHLKTTRV